MITCLETGFFKDMDYKRITIIAGHYGSGKTNLAVNIAYDLKNKYENVVLADADIVNPYFRSKDSEAELSAAGIRLISSKYAGSNVDIPAMPQEFYSITDDRSIHAVMDIGGDDRGAYALGRFSEMIVNENDYDMLAVINMYRPLTRDVDSTIEILREIENAAHISFTGIVNNSNLAEETQINDILASQKYAEQISLAMNIPIKMTGVKYDLYEALKGSLPGLFPMRLQQKI